MHQFTRRWRKTILVLLWLSIRGSVYTQELDGYEYWFDNEIALRTVVNQNLGQIANLSQTIPTDGLSDGFHNLSIRFTQSQSPNSDRFSSVSTYRFFKESDPNAHVLGYEYWIDGDRSGLVKEQITPAAGNSVIIMPTIDVNNLSDGFHVISFRVLLSNGWSSVSTYQFFKKAINSSDSYEYWFDGNRNTLVSNPLSMSGNQLLINEPVGLGNLNDGLHTISIRTRSSAGWSAASTYQFYKQTALPAGGITTWEYWWDDHFDEAIRKEIIPAATDKAILNLPLDISELCKGMHTFNVRFFGSNGWSSVVRDTFNKFTPKAGEEVADFDVITDGGVASFLNKSKNGSGYAWNFGDGQTSTIANPFHQYSSGVYQVVLVNYGFCENDTIRKSIVIPGVSGYSPNKGGKNAMVTMTLTGVGFAPGMDVRLKRNGQADILADELVQNTGFMSAKFKFQNAMPGNWDVFVDFPGPATITFPEGLLIEDTTYAKIKVKLLSNWRMRTGVKNPMTVSVSNEGNADARCVPITIGGFPAGTKIELESQIIDILWVIPGFDIDTTAFPKDSFPTLFTDENGKAIKPLIMLEIPAGQTKTLQLQITPPPTPATASHEIYGIAGKPLLDGNNDDQAIDCFKAIIKTAAKFYFSEQSDLIQCISSIGLTMHSIYEAGQNLSNQDGFSQKSVIEYSTIMFGIIQTGAKCAKAAGQTIPIIKLAETLKTSIKIFNAAKLLVECAPVFETISDDFLDILIGNSFDPNIKVGPGNGPTNPYYATGSGPLDYLIQCENDTSALFAAQTVTIIDTLDIEKLDISSFQFTHVNVAGRGTGIYSKEPQFIRDILLPAGIIARVSGQLDPSKGIITWIIRTIDANTGQITTDPEAGILKPNFNPPEGEAGVGFSIRRVDGLPDDVLIKNRAVIIFDNNDPIITNTWGVIGDNIPPFSEINPLPPTQDSLNIHLSWSGSDNRSGVQYYQIYASDEGNAYYQWRSYEKGNEAVFIGQAGHRYRFYSIAIDSAQNIEPAPMSFDAEIQIGGAISVKEPNLNTYYLGQNIPNPFTGQTRIDYTLPEFCPALNFVISDISGRVVKSISMQNQVSGQYSLSFEAGELQPGMYFYQLKTPKINLIKRMVCQKF